MQEINENVKSRGWLEKAKLRWSQRAPDTYHYWLQLEPPSLYPWFCAADKVTS